MDKLPYNVTDKDYIGDSVYVGHDGYHIWLWLDNGFGPKSPIALEPHLFDALMHYKERVS